MATEIGKVAEIRKPISDEVADRAYQLWVARCFRNMSPEMALLQAALEVSFEQKERPAGRPFLVRNPARFS